MTRKGLGLCMFLNPRGLAITKFGNCVVVYLSPRPAGEGSGEREKMGVLGIALNAHSSLTPALSPRRGSLFL